MTVVPDRELREQIAAEFRTTPTPAPLSRRFLSCPHWSVTALPDRLESLAQDAGVARGDVIASCVALWGTCMWKVERERRLVASGVEVSNPTRVRTIRGHLTRAMTQELREYLAANPSPEDNSCRC